MKGLGHRDSASFRTNLDSRVHADEFVLASLRDVMEIPLQLDRLGYSAKLQ